MTGAGRPGTGHRLLLAAAALLMAGCAPTAGFCTLAGCLSSLQVVLDLPAGTTGPVDVEVCVAQRCEATVIVDAAANRPAELSTLRVVDQQRVTLTVRATQHGQVLATGTRDVHLQRLAPNGKKCGPVCYRGQVRLGSGGLSRASAPT
jgi:hypothetical protein